MRLDGYGLFVRDMAVMIRFYRDVLGFEIKEAENTTNVYLVKDGTLFLLYGRKDFVFVAVCEYADKYCDDTIHIIRQEIYQGTCCTI